MRIISNGISDKIVVSLVFEVTSRMNFSPSHKRYSYYYHFNGSKECFLCGIKSESNYEISYEDEQGEVSDGICFHCYSRSREFGEIKNKIQIFLGTAGDKYLKVLKKKKVYARDYNTKIYKVNLPKGLVKDINSFLIKKSREQLKRYQNKLRRNKSYK